MSRTLKYVLVCITAILIIGAIVFFVLAHFMFSSFESDETFTKKDLIENFNKKSTEISDLRSYFKHIVPANKNIEIEFDNDEISRLVIAPNDIGKNANTAVEFEDWNIDVNSKKMDSLLVVLNWSKDGLNTLKQKLEYANCISIASGEPTVIGFKRSGLGMYFFDVFDKPISDDKIERYNDSCTYILVNRKLVLEYGGGAIGPQCFSKDVFK